MPNLIVNRRLLSGSSVKYDIDAEAYFIRAGITDKIEKNAWNAFVVGAKAANIYNKFIAVYPVSPTSIGASYYNAISSSYTISTTAAPFYSIGGWTGDGTTQFLKTGIIPNSHLTLDNVTFGVRSSSNIQSNGIVIGSVSSTNSHCYGRIRSTSDLMRMSYTTNATLFDAANTNGSGNFFWGALSSTSRYIRRNTTSIGTSSATHGSTQPTHEIYLLARNNIGTADSFYNGQINFAFVANGLSTSECDTLSGLIDTYSANVISGGR